MTPKAEVSTEELPTASPVKKAANVVNKTKMLDSDIIEKAAASATADANTAAMNNIPKTAAGFEKDFN